MNQKKLANLGLFAAVAIIFGYVESLIPFFAGIPGMKLGLANLAVLFILEKYTWKEAALVSVIRIFIIKTVINNPILIGIWIHINTGDYTDAFDNSTCISTVLATNHLYF